jgi:hypothetical protein
MDSSAGYYQMESKINLLERRCENLLQDNKQLERELEQRKESYSKQITELKEQLKESEKITNILKGRLTTIGRLSETVPVAHSHLCPCFTCVKGRKETWDKQTSVVPTNAPSLSI